MWHDPVLVSTYASTHRKFDNFAGAIAWLESQTSRNNPDDRAPYPAWEKPANWTPKTMMRLFQSGQRLIV